MSRDQNDSGTPPPADTTVATAAPAQGPAEQLREPKAFSLGDPIEQLKHSEVVVHANGFVYRGILLGADENEIYLRTNTRYTTIRMEQVSKLQRADQRDQLNPAKQVDPAFYQVDDLPDDGEPG